MSYSAGDGYDAAEPIAVVGMAMRFPGDSNSGEKFWEMLSKGRSAHGEVPRERFNAKGYYHPDLARAGSINTRGSYFLSEDPTQFDAPFFSMTANEANGTDPQQRLMLEVAYETLENAGIPVHTVAGSSTSVYVGCFTKDFESVGGRDPYGGPFYAATGNGQSMLSNRVSWFFDLRGPSMTIDTACSSSLHAVHLACQSLKVGESRLALVGGTNLIYDPSYMRDMVTMTFFSPDGICHSFDHRASGYARGDGIGGMVLKTLKQALADGDTIRGIIRNSGLNQDGKTPGITMPSPKAQADLIRSTYAGARLSMDQTAYFEAHGTGTAIGDPGEASAIGLTFGLTRPPDNPIYLGSVKTNIGHLEGCAGLAGLIKAVLVVEQGQIPPLAGFEKANPMLKLDEWRVALPEKLTPWPLRGLRRASVNSFGYGGANAHLIVDDAYHYLEDHGLKANHQTRTYRIEPGADSGFSSAASTPASEIERSGNGNKLFVFSSSDQAGLQRLATAYSQFLSRRTDNEKQLGSTNAVDWFSFMSDLAFTLCSRRSTLDHRSFVVAKSATELAEQLQIGIPKLRRSAKTSNGIFVFTGQGAQWPSMGKELFIHQAFSDSLERAETAVRNLGCTWSLVEELFATKEASRIDSPEFSQPLCTALQLALVDLLRTWAVYPKAVVGHSSGEIGAAYAAGVISHANAMKVAYLRGVYSADVNRRQPLRRGAMLAVGLSPEAVKPYLDCCEPETVVVACMNAPSSVTLSGDKNSIEYLEKLLKDSGIFARKLRVDTAYHSSHMRIIAEDYLSSMGTLEPPQAAVGGVVMFSSVTAAPIAAQDLNAAYWVSNMLNPVRFSDAVRALITQPSTGRARRKAAVNYSAIIECGPAEALKGPLNQILVAIDEKLIASVPYTSLLSRGVDAEVTAMQAAGRFWAQGLNVDLSMVNFQSLSKNHKVLANLPTYPWNHSTSYYHESAWGKRYRYREKPRTDLLGMRLENQDPSEPRWHNYVRLAEQPWMADHKVQQIMVYPGAAMITMAIEAAKELADPERQLKAIEARDILFIKGLVIPSGETAVETAIHLRPITDGSIQSTSYNFRVFSQSGGESWQENCSGSVSIHYRNDSRDSDTESHSWDSHTALYADICKRSTKTISPKLFYKLFDRKMNLQYGPLHQNVTECVAGTGEGHGTVTIPDTQAVMPSQFEYPHLIHPSTLDAMFHMQALGYLHSLSGEESLIPISIASVYVAADVPTTPGSQMKGYSKGTQSESGDSIGDIVLSNDQWLRPKAIVRGFLSRDMSLNTVNHAAPNTQPRKCTSLQWVEIDQLGASTRGTPDAKEEGTPASEGKTELSTTLPVPEIELTEVILLHSADASDELQRLVEKLTIRLHTSGRDVRSMAISEMTSEDLKGKTIISLLEAEEPLIAKWTSEGFERWKSLATQARAMLWITRGGDYTTDKSLESSISTGLLRTVRVERPQLKLSQIDLSTSSELSTDSTVDAIVQAFTSSILRDAGAVEQEFIETDGKLLVPRLVTQEDFHAELAPGSGQKPSQMQPLKSIDQPMKADLNVDEHLQWTLDDGLKDPLTAFDVEIQISVVGLEYKNSSASIRDAVGVVVGCGSAVTNFVLGDSVVTCASNTSQTHRRSHQDLVRHVPKSISPSVAAAMPSALCTAEIALVDCARLQPGESILICSGTGSTSQAMILLAMQIGANVFATSENSTHKRLLIERLGIAEDHVLSSACNVVSSKTLDSLTHNNGVDVIVNMFSETATEALTGNLANFGRFVSLGKKSKAQNAGVHAHNVASFSVDLEEMELSAPSKLARIFGRSWDRVQTGLMDNLTSRTFSCSDTEKAVQYLRSEECVGGAALTISKEDVVSVLPPPPTKLRLDPEASYVLSGGLGGVGRSIAEMMVLAGARKISFISRSGARSAEARRLLDSLRERGCNAQAYCCDISDASQVSAFVTASSERGEIIKGVIQCAMVLRDSTFDNMTYSQWTESTKPKIRGSWNLHAYLPPTLDFFIMLSSMAGIIGNPGQANYSAAGTYQDALSLHRRAQGLSSMTIDLGIVSDVGYIAENADQFERLEYLEPLFISERDLHRIVAAAMLGHTMNGAPVPAQLITGVGKELLQDGSIGTAMASDLKYTHLHAQAGAESGTGDSSADEMIKIDLKAASTLRDASVVVEGVLAAQLAKALTTEKENVDLEKPMHDYGVDSLVAVEVRNMIFRRFKADISIFDILSSMPLAKLAVKIVSKSQYVRAEVVALALEDVAE